MSGKDLHKQLQGSAATTVGIPCYLPDHPSLMHLTLDFW
jgi:uncharacterized protein Usg